MVQLPARRGALGLGAGACVGALSEIRDYGVFLWRRLRKYVILTTIMLRLHASHLQKVQNYVSAEFV